MYSFIRIYTILIHVMNSSNPPRRKNVLNKFFNLCHKDKYLHEQHSDDTAEFIRITFASINKYNIFYNYNLFFIFIMKVLYI